MAHIECICPPKADGEPRHPGGDEVELRESLDFRGMLTARRELMMAKDDDPDISTAEILSLLTETYLLLGVRKWTLTDERGKAIPVSKPAIRERLLSHPEAAMVVGDEADGLYSEAVVLPLVARASKSSPPTSITDSTSATNGHTSTPRKRSKPSSTTTSRTGGIVTIVPSPDGDSSLSQSSA